MITRKELEEYGQRLGFNAYQAEKDYLQHAFLASLYSSSATEFVFKGGTALQKAYGLNRFSEDLDFTINTTEDVLPLLEKSATRMGGFAETTLLKGEKTEFSVNAKLKIRGPLYARSDRSLATIVLEMSLRENILVKPNVTSIVPQYPDLQPYSAFVMSPDEMLAEKIRAIITRNKPRDLYDSWFLLRKGIRFDLHLADKKLKLYGKEFDLKVFEKAAGALSKSWQKDLGLLMRNPPEFKEIKKYVLETIR